MIAAEEEKFKSGPVSFNLYPCFDQNDVHPRAIIKEIEDIRAGLLGTEIQPRPIEAHIEVYHMF